MRKQIILLITMIFILTSCTKKEQILNNWNSESCTQIFGEYKGGNRPIAIIWVKPAEGVKNIFYVYKSFYEINELNNIQNGLCDPDIIEKNRNVEGEQLRLYFLDGTSCVVSFYLDNEKKEFVGPRGKDKSLYKLFVDKNESENYFRYEVDPNKIRESQMKLNEMINKIKNK